MVRSTRRKSPRRTSRRRKKPTLADIRALEATHAAAIHALIGTQREALAERGATIADLRRENDSLQSQANIWSGTAQRQSHRLNELRHVVVDQAQELTSLRDQLKTRSRQEAGHAVAVSR